MSLPVGITTCTVTVGAAYTFAGEEGIVSGSVVADRNVVWAATGAPIFKTASDVTASISGGQASFSVPHVDQDGFLDNAGNAITGWYYVFNGRATFEGGRVEIITKRFQAFVGQTTIDLDLVPDGPVIPGVTTPSAAVLSVNGQTGTVVIEEDVTAAVVAALADDETVVAAAADAVDTALGDTDYGAGIVGAGRSAGSPLPSIGNPRKASPRVTTLGGIVANKDTASIATEVCYAATFHGTFGAASPGRTAEFYILHPDGGNLFTPTWRSGVIAAEGETVSFSPTGIPLVEVQPGDIIGAWSNTRDVDATGWRISRSNDGDTTMGVVYWAGYGAPDGSVPPARLIVGTQFGSGPWNEWNYTGEVSLNANISLDVFGADEVNVSTRHANQAYGYPRLNAQGTLPPKITSYWNGKTIGVVGTSIDLGVDADVINGQRNGYINQMADFLGATIDNQGVSGSRVQWDGTFAKSLGATRAQLTTAGFDPNESYETKLVARTADLWLLGFGYNDQSVPLGTITDTTPGTFYGAYNTVIAAKLAATPAQQFAFLTPVSAHAPTNGDPGENPGLIAIRTAIIALGRAWGFPVLDWTFSLGVNETTKTLYQPDGIHPSQVIHDRAARQLAHFVNGL